MSKSILVFFHGRPFGVFSNKSNAWDAIRKNYEQSDLCYFSEKKNEYRDATYSMLANRLAKNNKFNIFSREDVLAHEQSLRDIEAETEKLKAENVANGTPDAPIENTVTEKGLIPTIYVYQMITNVGKDGVLYKNSENPIDPKEDTENTDKEETGEDKEEDAEK